MALGGAFSRAPERPRIADRVPDRAGAAVGRREACSRGRSAPLRKAWNAARRCGTRLSHHDSSTRSRRSRGSVAEAVQPAAAERGHEARVPQREQLRDLLAARTRAGAAAIPSSERRRHADLAGRGQPVRARRERVADRLQRALLTGIEIASARSYPARPGRRGGPRRCLLVDHHDDPEHDRGRADAQSDGRKRRVQPGPHPVSGAPQLGDASPRRSPPRTRCWSPRSPPRSRERRSPAPTQSTT